MGHEENQKGTGVRINLAGLGIGDGWTSPQHNARYGNFLYQVGLVDGNQRDQCLQYEQTTQQLIDQGRYYEAWESWNTEFGYFLNLMGCDYYYNIAICDFDPAEDNYEDFLDWPSTREAIHVGNLPFPSGGNVYYSMLDVFMETGMHDLEFSLEHYNTLIYNGNFDIICDHTGILDMLSDIQWSGKDAYEKAGTSVYRVGSEVVGYLKKASTMRLLLVKNAGHMVPLSQPPAAQKMIEELTS